MTLDVAIEILRKDIDNPGSVAIEDIAEAEELGIEALKYVEDARDITAPYLARLLRGETKE